MGWSVILGTVLALVAGSYLLQGFIFSQRDPQEPAYIQPSVPLIGHFLNYLKNGTPYFSHVEAKFPHLAIFSLPIFSFKLYIVADRQIFSAVQRNAKTVSFTPFARQVTKILSGVSDKTARAADTLSEDEDTRTLARLFHHAEASTLANGPSLDRINRVSSQEKLRLVDELVLESSENPVAVELYGWVQEVITMSATTGFYGPQNPYKDPQHKKDFWTFNDKIALITANLAWLFAPKAHKARKDNCARYGAYYRAGGVEHASDFVKERTRILIDSGAPPMEAVAINTGFDVALLSNYTGIAFWTVWNVISRPELLAAARKEAETAIIRGGDGDADFTLDLSVLRTSCPLLVSVLQETQRLKMWHANIREVISDTKISAAGRDYMLKKGNYVQLHGPPVLLSKELWGENADNFDPRRFIKKDDPSGSVLTPNQLPSMAFPVWGVAPHVCPARFYASTGVLVLVALMILKLDISPAGGEGAADQAWPEFGEMFNYSAVSQPTVPVNVSVRSRKEWMGRWGVTVGTPNTRLQFSVA
ncbi:hypothetical protein KVR01_006390 [Diaporthe batatas]|uniref:uncharacterized protein n=1 Tax=Diaporthe batatas TaxID=748121 RepID=UPI001D0577E3|nr:uncharacterized protein KVR01_006390 [Diaporthe batatas]KAG8164472.1 hypothetical protein KVR01_006390 [Diaporthe batatas]